MSSQLSQLLRTRYGQTMPFNCAKQADYERVMAVQPEERESVFVSIRTEAELENAAVMAQEPDAEPEPTEEVIGPAELDCTDLSDSCMADIAESIQQQQEA